MPDSNPGDTLEAAEPASPTAAAFATAEWHAKALLRVPRVGRRGGFLLVVFVLLAWVASGIFKVGPDEQGVVLRFGRWVSTELPGLHYHWPYPISTVLLPKVTSVNELRSQGATAGSAARRMLTGDENLVEAEYSVAWKIKDAGAFLFHVQDAEGLVRMAAETAMHEVIGRNEIQAAMSDRRQQIAADAQEELQRLLDAYGAGILVIQVQLQRVDPPAAVIDAFNDVQRARADQVRARNEAEAYHNDVLPRARGEAEHVVQDAEAYRTQAIDQAQGDVSAFLSSYKAYQQAPEVFSWRLYLDSMDDLLHRASRVVVDASGKGLSNIVPLMPLDMSGRRPEMNMMMPSAAAPSPSPAAAAPRPGTRP